MRRVVLFAILSACLCCSLAQAQREGSKPVTQAMGALDILSDTKGVDFGPYLQRVLHDVKMNWYSRMPEETRSPQFKQGKLAIEFMIKKNGEVDHMVLVGPSGDTALDRAAWEGIRQSSPFPSLPSKFPDAEIKLRLRFYYNPPNGKIPEEPKKN